MKIEAVYGGAFNPPTRGHALIIEQALTSKQVAKVVFNPDGLREDKDYAVDLEKRKQMIRVFYEELKEKGLDVEWCDYFLEGKNGDKTRSVDVEKFFIEHFGKHLWHIFGVDVITQMANWKGNEDGYIENKLKKLFVPRKGYILPNPIPLQNFKLLDLDIPLVSSTMVREAIKARKNDVSELLTPGVEKFVRDNQMYI